MINRNAKAWTAFVLSIVTALQEIYVGNTYLRIACIVVTAVGVYLVPNTPDTTAQPPAYGARDNVV